MIAGFGRVVTGLDVGSTSVKAVRLAHRRSGVRLLGLALAELSEHSDSEEGDESVGARASDAIRTVLARCGTGTRGSPSIVSAVGAPGVSIKHVNFPSMPEHALAESIRWEARKHVPFGGTEFVLDFQSMKTSAGDGGDTEVVLAAVETKILDDHLGLLEAAGVEPEIVDLTPLALMNEVHEQGLVDSDTLAVIDLGPSVLNLAIYKTGGLFFARTVPMLSGRGSRRPQASRSEPDREPAALAASVPETPKDPDRPPNPKEWRGAVLKEVRRSLTFYNNETGKQGIEKIYLTGGLALTPGIQKAFQENLGIATEVLDPLKTITDSAVDVGELGSQGPRFAVAMGLARRT